MKNDACSPADLREVLDYDPITGRFDWREPQPSWFKSVGHWRAYLAFVAGKQPMTDPHSAGYLWGSVLGEQMLAHRVAWAWYYGEWPDAEIDHIDHVRSSNPIHNLRVAGRVGNMRNASLRQDNTSGVTGVTWQADRRKWAAQIGVHGRIIPLGRFDKFDDAVTARKAAEQRYGFHPNHGTLAAPETDA